MARFAVANLQDQSAAVWIVAILLLAYTTLTTLVRGFVKSSMPGLDDGVAGLAQLFTYGNAFSVIYALLHGLAKTRPNDAVAKNETHYEEALQASIILYVLALAAAKVTTVLFMGRIFRGAGYTRAILLCNIVMAAMILWSIGAVTAVSVNCGSKHLWQMNEAATCNGNTRWLVVAIFDGLTELGISIFAICLVSRLHMTMKKKLTVFTAFLWRLGLIVMAALHYRSYLLIQHSQDMDTSISKLVIWEQISICYSLLSITWPFSKAFINGFDTAPLAAVSAYASGTATHESAVAKVRSRIDSATPNRHPWQIENTHSKSTCSHPKGSSRANGSFGSEEMIIRRDHEVIVFSSADDGTIRGSISPLCDYR